MKFIFLYKFCNSYKSIVKVIKNSEYQSKFETVLGMGKYEGYVFWESNRNFALFNWKSLERRVNECNLIIDKMLYFMKKSAKGFWPEFKDLVVANSIDDSIFLKDGEYLGKRYDVCAAVWENQLWFGNSGVNFEPLNINHIEKLFWSIGIMFTNCWSSQTNMLTG